MRLERSGLGASEGQIGQNLRKKQHHSLNILMKNIFQISLM